MRGCGIVSALCNRGPTNSRCKVEGCEKIERNSRREWSTAKSASIFIITPSSGAA
jgi:hypothetical protein